MKHALWLVLLLSAPLVAQDPGKGQRVYVSCGKAQEVQVFDLDPEGALSPRSKLALPGRPGAMALSPDRARIYVAAAERKRGRGWIERIHTLRRLPAGRLEIEHSLELTGGRPTFLRVAGGFLLSASYGGGQVSVYALEQGRCTQRVARKTTAKKAHMVEVDPSGRFVFVPHTGPNAVYQLRFDPKTGALEPNDPPRVAGPEPGRDVHEPRHLRFHPRLPFAYSSNEHGGGISAWRLDPKAGTLKLVQTLSTLPEGFQGKSSGAEVRITPDGRFAYVSNRDHRKQDPQDTLAVFAIDGEGGLRKAGHARCPHFPRAFSLDAKGERVLVAGQRDHRLAVYRIAEDGALRELSRREVGEGPAWVLCVAD